MNSYKKRVFLTVTFGLIGVLGVVLVISNFVDLSTLIKNNGETSENAYIEPDSQDQYTPQSSIKGISTSSIENPDTILIGNKILAKEIIRPYLKITTDKNIIIAKVINSGEISPIYIIPSDSENIKLYEDDVMLYTRSLKDYSEVNIQKDNIREIIKVSSDNNFFIEDIEYSQDESIFYVLTREKDQLSLDWFSSNKPKLNKVKNLDNLDSIIQKLVSVSKSQIAMSDNTNQLCYAYNLYENTIKKITCINNNPYVISNSKFYLKDSTDALFKMPTSKIRSDFFIYQDKIIFSERSIADNTDQALGLINIPNKEEQVIAASFPNYINELFAYNNIVYVISQNKIFSLALDSENAELTQLDIKFGNILNIGTLN
ncbi:hypothetical protein KC678_00260 [Candidatus Dojkabacteria bacterium]|uniref:Uncharacterized protein n=1 Tax=Candidatus Dojkabacteria bacterium TaxID=2099670 RepID=A0A955IAJ2_9BACT|nr:hypothetical protein [Candidatus Dojkabacteria bacterium]